MKKLLIMIDARRFFTVALLVFVCSTLGCDRSRGFTTKRHAPPAGDLRVLKVGEIRCRFHWIPSGEFDMGSPQNENGRGLNEVLHHVKHSRGYWLLETPVTQRLYSEVMGANPSSFLGDDLPVENVNYEQALKFCEEFSKRLPRKLVARLPTEAEWEYACRAGTSTPFYWGDVLNGEEANCDGKNFPYGTETSGSYQGKTTPVGNYKPNAWGLLDMNGEVWEWCEDWYGDYPDDEVVDPQGPETGSTRVCRGGSWNDNPAYCRAACRHSQQPSAHSSELGFRIILDEAD